VSQQQRGDAGSANPGGRWQALAFALTGEVREDLAARDDLDVAGVVDLLGGPAAIAEHRRSSAAWPHPVPIELRQGVGPAQLQALLSDVLSRLRTAETSASAVVSTRPLSAEELRLSRDVPPHHG
jgi:hypothetical protein